MLETETRYFERIDDVSPAIVVQVTRLDGSYMLWLGLSDGGAEDVESVPQNGFLCRDWAVAMPPLSDNVPPSGTSLFSSSTSDMALPMAKRLARRFKKQIYLSVDLPPTFLSMGNGPKIALEAEKRVVQTLKELEG